MLRRRQTGDGMLSVDWVADTSEREIIECLLAYAGATAIEQKAA